METGSAQPFSFSARRNISASGLFSTYETWPDSQMTRSNQNPCLLKAGKNLKMLSI